MKCYKCPFYKDTYYENECRVTGDMFFRQQEDCTLVNDDGTKNEEEIQKMFGGK
jgi:hypothetical protein